MDGSAAPQRQTDGDTQYTHQIIIKIPCRLAEPFKKNLQNFSDTCIYGALNINKKN